jgi:hypothetical protein
LSFSDRRNTVLSKSVLQYLYLLIVSTNGFYDGYWVVGVLAGVDLEDGKHEGRSAVKFSFLLRQGWGGGGWLEAQNKTADRSWVSGGDRRLVVAQRINRGYTSCRSQLVVQCSLF